MKRVTREPTKGRGRAATTKAMAELEGVIDRHEQMLVELTQRIEAASEKADVRTLRELGAEFQEVQAELEMLLAKWSALV